MVTLGGDHHETAAPDRKVTPPETRNKGTHILHMGGKYDSCLQVPEVKR